MREYISVLKRTKIFNTLTDEQILCVSECLGATVKRYGKGTLIYREGATAMLIGIILNGEIETQKTDYMGNANIISKLFPSDLIAAAACYSTQSQLPFDVVAVCDTEVLCLNKVKLASPCPKACEFHNKIIENLLCVLADKNINLSNKIDILTRRNIREKILSYLYSKSRKAKGENFSINLTRREMADYLSINRSALSRELCKMRDEGVLEFNNNIFCIKD